MGTDRAFVTGETKQFQLDFNIMRGFKADGGHGETKGLSHTGQVIQIPKHRHHVSLRFFHFNTRLRYQLSPKLGISLVVPYTIKEQIASVEWPDHQPTPDERDASRRNGYIHHRDETYQGFEDPNLSVFYKFRGVLKANDMLTFSGGLSVPIGQIEPDPYKLGDDGQKHLHIQFGTGTLTPGVEIRYWMPIAKSIALQTTLVTRRPFYENEHEFLTPADTSFFLSAVYEPTQILRLRSSWMFLRQGSGYWSGEKDINTGLRMHALILGANIGRHTRLNTSLIVPIRQRMLDGDAFEHGVLLSIGMSQPL